MPLVCCFVFKIISVKAIIKYVNSIGIVNATEVVNWKVLVDEDGYAGAKAKGVLRLEGKEYIVQEADVMHFRFNV